MYKVNIVTLNVAVLVLSFFLLQAQFQAQQMQEKEKRMLNMMAVRQEEAVRRFEKLAVFFMEF